MNIRDIINEELKLTDLKEATVDEELPAAEEEPLLLVPTFTLPLLLVLMLLLSTFPLLIAKTPVMLPMLLVMIYPPQI